MDSLKKQTAKKEEEVEEKPPDPEFEVEHIVDYSLDKVTVSCPCIAFKDVKHQNYYVVWPLQMKGLYRVHWKGWSDDDDTWETMENLTDCKDMLKEFYIKRLQEREKATPSQ